MSSIQLIVLRLTGQPLAKLCDGKHDCSDEFDEKNCSSTTRVYQVLQMGVDERTINQSSLLFYWWLPISDKVKLEFLPSISKMGVNEFENKTWMEYTEYQFFNLLPYTKYNITVYVRLKESKTVFPPANYFIVTTGEAMPSAPWNVTVEQKNGSHVLISWNKPVHPNGLIQSYEICWFPPEPPLKLRISDNSTAHLLSADFHPHQKYSFYVIANNRVYNSEHSEIKSLVFDGESENPAKTFLPNKTNTRDADYFTCNNNMYIPKVWRCDNEDDCGDGSDENGCYEQEPISCKTDEFHCSGGGIICIPGVWRCDLDNDCKDGSDEINCSNNKCDDNQYSCGPPSFRCIYASWICDGDKDCSNGIDEKNCTTTK